MGRNVDVLITGGAGFIGSHVVDHLAMRGHRVVVVDNYVTGSPDNLRQHASNPDVDVVEADVATAATIEVIAAARPRVIVHLAAQMDVRKSVSSPVDDARTNVLGTVNVLTGAADAGTERIVFASSGGCIYGEVDDRIAIREDGPVEPLSPYGAAKVAAEAYIAQFGRLHGIGWVSLALGNVFGPRQNPHGEAGVVAIFMERILNGEPVLIFGDGLQVRDFVYVTDVAEAMVLACSSAYTGRLNVGTGVPTTIEDLFRATSAAVATDLAAVTYHPHRPGELAWNCLDPDLARRRLGWTPSTSLEDGLERTMAWMQEDDLVRSDAEQALVDRPVVGAHQ